MATQAFGAELSACRVFLNTPKWNEAYGNVEAEAMGRSAGLDRRGCRHWFEQHHSIEASTPRTSQPPAPR